MTRVKICGLQRLDDVLAAVDAGADLLGFVFAPSRRQLRPFEARELMERSKISSYHVDGRANSEGRVKTVGVFVNASPDEINRVARECSLDYAQLSGEEPDAMIAALDVSAIQVVHVQDGMEPNEVADLIGGSSAEIVLLDTGRASSHGGTGQTFDWRVVPAVQRPVMVAGGLHAGNVAEAVRSVGPWGVDVSSGVELDGKKDPQRIVEFIRAVRA